MKLYTKVFTEDELIAIREALRNYKHLLKSNEPQSPAAIKHKTAVSVLLEDFKNTIK
jgi:hypothetical protein